MKKDSSRFVAIVDDSPLARHATKYVLSSNNIAIAFSCENGRECIDKLTEISQKPDIILLDLEMPVMNGFQTAVIVKDKWPEIKIIALSGSDDPESISKSLAAGADYFLSKHREPEVLVDLIYSVFEEISLQ